MKKVKMLPKKTSKFVSIVVPALNEALTIGEFVDWCKQGLKAAGVKGEILIIDSSTDNTAKIAKAHGARVIRMPKKGLGQAYIDAGQHIKGDYIIMGDCDLTYDFRIIKPFIDKLDAGHEFVMGTRLKGGIEPGAMPPLHRYFGTPLTTFILNFIYGGRFSDIACGMRAMTREALQKINLESASWQYASEMILKAAKLNLRVAEVPIPFYKDRQGRVSHHKRKGWYSPWYAGWINLQVMFLYAPDFFLMLPGTLSFGLGFFLVLLLTKGPVQIGVIGLSWHAMFLGVILMVLGYAAVQMGILAKVVYDFNPRKTRIYKRIFTYNQGVILGGLSIAMGLALGAYFMVDYIREDFRLQIVSAPAILGLMLMLFGFQTFTFTLVFQMILNKNKNISHASPHQGEA
ncbi:glycosyltransferase family 2 protein [candidate division FCPU426 bacterium]|nr:glycosyltransferase family 2 protein [candidate division FCPU426 bacterium]